MKCSSCKADTLPEMFVKGTRVCKPCRREASRARRAREKARFLADGGRLSNECACGAKKHPKEDSCPTCRGCSVEGCDAKHFCKGLCKNHDEARRRSENREHYGDVRAAWRAANLDKARGYKRAARINNPESHRNRDRLNRIRRRAAMYGAEFDPSVCVESLKDKYGSLCVYCGVGLKFLEGVHEYEPLRATIEHVVPLKGGGSHTFANCRLACLQCNHKKGSKSLEQFLEVSVRRAYLSEGRSVEIVASLGLALI